MRKRKPGGGRKPKGPIGGNTAVLQARITADLSARLDREAKKNRRSRSQEAQLRLQQSFDFPAKLQDDWGPADVWALAQLVSRVVRSIHSSVSNNPFDEAGALAWHRDPFTHAAVTTAIGAILADKKPEGPPRVPEEIEKRAAQIEQMSSSEQAAPWRTPEGIGLSCARGVLLQVDTAATPPKLRKDVYYASGYHVFPHIRKILEKERAP